MSMMFRVSVAKHIITDDLPVWIQHTSDTINDERLNAYRQWCKKNIGKNGWNYFGRYRKVPCEFRFRREEDLLAFRLTFGV